MPANRNLHQAKTDKNDEFYTQLVDIENELRHYSDHFRGKVVYCNCDDPRVSDFFPLPVRPARFRWIGMARWACRLRF